MMEAKVWPVWGDVRRDVSERWERVGVVVGEGVEWEWSVSGGKEGCVSGWECECVEWSVV